MQKIKSIESYEILSSGGAPSLEVKVVLENGMIGKASVPYGASAGSHEAQVIFDGDKNRYKGKGMLTAVDNINKTIAPELVGKDAEDQRAVDDLMVKLDGTPNKAKLGGNAILGVSLAVANAAANANNTPLYKYIRQTLSLDIKDWVLPNPMMVVIEGGAHADNSTDLQEYLFSVIGNDSAKENVRIGLEAYFKLKDVIKANGYSTNVGNEGAFAPDGIDTNERPLEMMMEAVKQAGLELGKDIAFSLDAAGSEFYKDGKYTLSVENKSFTTDELIAYYAEWFKKYPLVTVEDLLHEDDWAGWTKLNKVCADHKIKLVGDDLTVTNVERLQKAIDKDAISAILIKLNQIGSLTETVDTCMLARKHGIISIPSHRGGGETNDSSMVDVAVAVNGAFIKVGPTRGERVSKYNRLMEIERELTGNCRVAGSRFGEIA